MKTLQWEAERFVKPELNGCDIIKRTTQLKIWKRYELTIQRKVNLSGSYIEIWRT